MDLNYFKLLKNEDWILKVKTIDIKYLRDEMDCKCIFKTDGCQYGNINLELMKILGITIAVFLIQIFGTIWELERKP